jgi:isopenicillin-N N-acyltransferase-like protein
MELGEARRNVQAYMQPSLRLLPACVQELEGIAEGAHISFEDIFILNCEEELMREDSLPPTDRARCTSVAMAADDSLLLGHNEDWYASNLESNVLLDVELTDGTRFLCMTAATYLGATGMNSWGLAVSANLLHSCDTRVGVPNSLLLRSMLEARTLEDAQERACLVERARGSNHLLVDVAGRILNVETSATAAAAMSNSRWFVHTNHYLAPSLLEYETSTFVGTRKRLERATKMLEEAETTGDNPDRALRMILRDHRNHPDSICSHPDESLEKAEQFMTCASSIWDLPAMTVRVCAGPPCQNPYVNATSVLEYSA